ncbi:DegT/DnrJ/EryC1/StrS family aminotransferase [Sulfurimonas autotrophica]|uniref:DegT/DnrJ/EryC1/StrS aminotransferase n=1 Tax=Sulfurimonas autotrophica (strain ATCC BAA-671 / DSM 16294 / JCM 11897 / OK10) TaxID=563040 RepID=E0URK1_SULAO|nr:DegT/DnrJ/EryC1/StrS family aminotransferase [Sulfurimonas autotrophica]ADN08945.1 DegT/DnrJ/EryC1/StrS aminotransferase [Sulfurimonas autotrophica DSM 16294]
MKNEELNIPFNKYESSRDAHSNVSDALDGEDIHQVEKLEEEFCEYVGSEYALATSHGTSALHLAMLALDLKRGDKVICSVNSHPSVPEVVRHFDAEPVFIDIAEDSYNINLDKLENYLEDNKSKKLKAVIITHLGGVTVDLDRVYSMASIYGVKIVEDASDALGATYKGQKIGATGADIVCFNFSPHLKKNICNGGMLVSNDEDIMQRARLLANHAMVRDEDALEYIYDVIDIGNDYSLSHLNAAYIRAQVKEQDANIARQKEIAKMYTGALNGIEHVTTPDMSNKENPFSLYIVKIDKNRDSFAVALKEEGIGTGLHYIPLHLLTYYKSKYSLRVNDFPVALRSFQQVLSLPIYASMSDEDVKSVISKIKKIAKTRV